MSHSNDGFGAKDAKSPVPRTQGPPSRSLETVLALSLCLVVLLGSMALVRTDRGFSSAIEELSREPRPLAHRPDDPFREPPRLVCLLSLGGLRADRLALADEPVHTDGLASADAPTGEASTSSSELGALENAAISFHWAAAQATQPLASVKTILTGKYPSSLILEETGADLDALVNVEAQRTFLLEAFAHAKGTLAAGLAGAGYRTAGFACGRTTSRENGFAAGFDRFDHVEGGLAAAAERARIWLASSDPRANFVFLETQEIACSAATDSPREAYDRACARVDAALGTFFGSLRERGLFEEALIVVTADHGLSLGERGARELEGDLYLEQLRVPLWIKFPARWNVPARDVDGPVELVDLLPTILQACGRAIPPGLDGSSLLPLVFRGVHGRKLLVAQTRLVPGSESATRRAFVDPDHWQVIHDARTGEILFFDLSADPAGLEPRDPRSPDAPPFVRELLQGRTAPATPESSLPAPGTSSAAPVR